VQKLLSIDQVCSSPYIVRSISLAVCFGCEIGIKIPNFVVELVDVECGVGKLG
jgi:hypothetical protein